MKSIIFKFINEDGDQAISIGSIGYMNITRKTCNQLVCMLQWNHTEDDWEYMKSLKQEELLYALEYAIQKNPLHVLYMN